MEENSDSGLVPSLTLVVENIFSSCDPESSDAVSASTLIDFMRPHLSNHPEGVTVLQSFLDPNEENPFISRTSFYEAMKKWTTQIYEGESKLSNISLRESDTNEKNLPFHQSTPKASLAPGSMQDFSNIFNLTNLSGTSMGNSDKSNSTVGCGKLLEEKVKELEFKYVNALSELSMVKSQLALSEEQYAELRLDLDRTNKRLLLEQQVNADLQKSMDHTDEVKEEVFNAKREMEHLQRMWTSAKKENANLVASMKNLELERDQLDAKIIEIRKKDEQRKQELADLRAIVEESKEENKTLKTFSSDLEKKLEEQNSLLKHFSEISEFMKNENHTLRSVIKKAGVLDFTKYPSLKNIPDLSPQGTPTNSPRTRLLKSVLKSSTPFKNMYHPIMFERHVFNSPKFIKQLSSPVSPDGLDTPTDIKTIEFPETGVNLNEQSVDYSGIIDSPKDEIHNLKREEGEELVESDHKYSPSAEIRCDSPDTKIDLGNSISQTMDDLDLSEGSEIAGNKGQDLRSELQGCTFFDNRNNCFNEDHMEWLKIVEEHENCSKIINEYQQRLELLSKDVEVVETENNNLQNKYKHLEENTNYLKMTVNAEKIENEVLVEKNSKLTREITSLHDSLQIKTKEILEMHNMKVQQEKLSEEILKLRSENEDNLSKHHLLLKKYDSLASEKETIEKELEQIRTEKENLLNEYNSLCCRNNNLNKAIELKQKELREMENEQEKNCLNVEKLTKKLEECSIIGKQFVDLIKRKLCDQNIKVEFLKGFNKKLEEDVEELQTEVEDTKTKMYILQSTIDNIPTKGPCKLEESTSTEESETNLLSSRPEFRKKSSYIRKSNYEKQQFKIDKLEDRVESLEKELSAEKSKNQKLCALSFQVRNLKLERTNLQEEKDSILRELEAIKYDLSLKDQMMGQFEEKYKFEIDNLTKSTGKEKELINLALIEAEKKAGKLQEEKKNIQKELETVVHDLSLFKEKYELEIENLRKLLKEERESVNLALIKTQQAKANEELLNIQLEKVRENLHECEQEKKRLEKSLRKQEMKVIHLKKTLSDLSVSSEKSKALDDILLEKESMLKFNRELLAKSNNSLQLAENRVSALEFLLNKCRGVILETSRDVFSAALLAFGVWKHILKTSHVEDKLIDDLEAFENTTTETVTDLSEQVIWSVNNQLLLCSQLLVALAKKCESIPSYKPEVPLVKSISKFTLKPSKLKLRRLPNSEPDLYSSCLKEVKHSRQATYCEFSTMRIEEIDSVKIKQEEITNNSVGTIRLKENSSITEWLGRRTDNLREALNNRKITEKKFCLLSATWKTNYENTKEKYSNFKHQCSKLRDRYLRTLLQIVTYIKGHKCRQEQKSLIQALKLFEKLKDLMVDVFKQAEQCGASRQELQSMKCWNLIVEYVNGVHRENEQLRLYRCTSVQMITDSSDNILRFRDVSTETENCEKSHQSTAVGESDIHVTSESTCTLEKSKDLPIFRKKFVEYIPYMLMVSLTIFVFIMFLIQLECLIKGGGNLMCPFDYFISFKRKSSSQL